MSKTYYLCLLVFLCQLSYSQDWNIISTNTEYYYSSTSADSIFDRVVKIDSLTNRGAINIYYPNKFSKVTIYSWEAIYYRNKISFLGDSLVKTDSQFVIYNKEDPSVILPHEKTGHKWEYRPNVSDTANVVSSGEVLIFNEIIDSIKIIVSCLGDSIIISKNYGVLFFKQHQLEEKYKLVGIKGDDIKGIQNTTFLDFFQFGIGDILEYKKFTNEQHKWQNYYFIRHEIKNVTYKSDSLILIVDTYQVSDEEQVHSIQYDFIPDNQIIYCKAQYSFLDDLPAENRKDMLPTQISINDSYNCLVKEHLYKEDFYATKDTTEFSLIFSHLSTFGVGIGLISKRILTLDPDFKLTEILLTGCKINNKVYGTIHDRESFVPDTCSMDTVTNITPHNLGDNKNLLVYPNPCKDILHLKLNHSQLESSTQIIIINVQGQVVKNSNVTTIDIRDLNNGVYFVKVKESQGDIYIRKVIIKN